MNTQFMMKTATAWLAQGPYLAMTVVAAAFASVFFAATAVHTMSGAIADENNANQAGKIKLNMTPASKADYLAAERACKGHVPDIRCETTSTGFRVIASSAEQYTDWMFAMSMLQAQDKGFVWTAKKICLGRCDQGAAVAELTASRQKIEIQMN